MDHTLFHKWLKKLNSKWPRVSDLKNTNLNPLDITWNNDRGVSQTRMWLTSSENPDPPTKGQIRQNEQEQNIPTPIDTVTCVREMTQDFPKSHGFFFL